MQRRAHPSSMPRSMALFLHLLATFVLFHLASQVSIASAQPTTVLFDNCPPTSATEGNPNKRLNITTVYAQIAQGNASSDHILRMTLFGETGAVLENYSNTTGYLGTSIPVFRAHWDLSVYQNRFLLLWGFTNCSIGRGATCCQE